MRIPMIMLVLLVAGVVSAQAAPSYLGPSGLMMTPDDSTLPEGRFNLGYHRFADLDFGGADADLDSWHGHYGLLDNLEVGLSLFDSENDDSEISINGKWRFVEETGEMPAVAVGVLDLAGDAIDDDPTLYVLASKGFGPQTTDMEGATVRSLRATVGVGSGFYDGLFAGAEWKAEPRLSFMAEFVQGGELLDEGDLFNGGARYDAGGGFTLDAALIDFDNLAFGVSYAGRF